MQTLPSISGAVNCANCDHYFPPPAERTRAAPFAPACPLPFPIDAIYTWVDGADPVHAAKRARHLTEAASVYAGGATLFRDSRELRYSLRSLTQYAPWIRRVYLVTDGQRPSWLAKDRQRPFWLRDHPELVLVDHTEIIPRQYLPTFNSHVIEAYLHRVPGLAEHYIYCNDDCFLAAPAFPGDFFTANGLPHLFVDWRKSRREGYERRPTPHARSWFNTRAELERRGVRSAPDLITAHTLHAQTKSNAEAAFAFFAEAIAAFSGNRFRTDGEMAFYCHAASLWAYAVKKAVPCDATYWYVNTKRKDRRRIYATLLEQKAAGRPPLFLCLNDAPVRGVRPFWRRHLARFMETYWPVPSPWEQY